VSDRSSLPLSLVTASPLPARPHPRSAPRPVGDPSVTDRPPAAAGLAALGLAALGLAERGLVQNALGPDERLLATLSGPEAGGTVTWLLTNRRLITLTSGAPEEAIATVDTGAITCVEHRTDPSGSWLRVRATGRQFTRSYADNAQAAHFCQLLRERAGIGSGQAPARRCAGSREVMRAGLNGLTPHSPR
jgi:hypothetical protein